MTTPPGDPSSLADELRKLVELRDDGVLTPGEFESQKARLLSAQASPAPQWTPPTFAQPLAPPQAGFPVPPSAPSRRRTRPWAWVLLGVIIVAVIVGVVADIGSGGGGGSSGPVAMGTAVAFSFGNGGTGNVTVEQVVAPATAGQYQLPAAAGDEYVGVQITVENTGSTNVLLDMGPLTALSDTAGQSYSWSPTSLSDCPPLANAGVGTLAPGTSVTGCVAFEVPTGDSLSQVTIGSSGKTPGVWNVG
jgi:hypothetical protein